MKFRHLRVAALAVATACFALLWAVPAFAAKNAATVKVTEGKPTEFGIVLSPKSVTHGTVTFKVTNSGNLPHDFKVCSSNKGGTANACAGKGTKQINPGASATLTITFAKAGKYEYLCTVSGHAAAGMKGVLTVK